MPQITPIPGYKGVITIEDRNSTVYRTEIHSKQDRDQFIERYCVLGRPILSTCDKAKKLLLPNFFSAAEKSNNLACGVFATVGKIILDLITLIPRLIIAPFRVTPNSHPIKELLPDVAFNSGVAKVKIKSNDTLVTAEGPSAIPTANVVRQEWKFPVKLNRHTTKLSRASLTETNVRQKISNLQQDPHSGLWTEIDNRRKIALS